MEKETELEIMEYPHSGGRVRKSYKTQDISWNSEWEAEI